MFYGLTTHLYLCTPTPYLSPADPSHLLRVLSVSQSFSDHALHVLKVKRTRAGGTAAGPVYDV